MNIDGLTMSVLCRELAHELVGSQIQRLLQPDKTTIVFKIHKDRSHKDLVITVGHVPACYVSEPLTDLPKEPSSLCMFLRKHLEGSRITGLTQIQGDRLLLLTADKLDLDGSLISNQIYIELMGKYSNCIFVQDGIVLESLIHVTPLMSHERVVAPKHPYEMPPNGNKLNLLEFSAPEIIALLRQYGEGSLSATVRKIFNGIGPILLDEICLRSSLSATTAYEELSESQLETLGNVLADLGEEIKKATGLYLYVNKKNKPQLSPVKLQAPEVWESTYQSRIEPLSPYFGEVVQKSGSIHNAQASLTKLVQQAIQREELRHQKIKDELEEADLANQHKAYGDLLMINAYLPVTYEKTVTVSNVLQEPAIDIEIPVKAGLTMVENAQYHYKLYTKLKNRLTIGQEQLATSTVRLTYLQSILYSLEAPSLDKVALQEIQTECEQAGLLKQKKKGMSIKKEGFKPLHISLDNGELFIGRNNQQNEYLTHRFGKPQDWWFHTLQIQGSHVLLRTPTEPTEEQILLAARYAAYYSKAKDSSKVPVDYTQIRYIKKPPASPPGFVIYTNQKTVYVDPWSPEEQA